MTDFFKMCKIDYVATKPATLNPTTNMLLEDQASFYIYVSFLLQFVNDSVPMNYVICIYSICSASVCISGFTEGHFKRKVPF